MDLKRAIRQEGMRSGATLGNVLKLKPSRPNPELECARVGLV
jgi:hypothetical protein